MGDLLAILGGQPLGGHRALARTRRASLRKSSGRGEVVLAAWGRTGGTCRSAMLQVDQGAVGLYWLPLGAGGHFVELGAVASTRRWWRGSSDVRRADLYHSALQVEVAEGTFVIEQAPVHD